MGLGPSDYPFEDIRQFVLLRPFLWDPRSGRAILTEEEYWKLKGRLDPGFCRDRMMQVRWFMQGYFAGSKKKSREDQDRRMRAYYARLEAKRKGRS